VHLKAMRHLPIAIAAVLALVTSAMPVVTVAPHHTLLEKIKSNLQEVRTRGGVLYVLADADSRIENAEGIHVI
jgi:glutamine---fructose-6-phosphate transaminase (isomerizing)